MLLRYFLNKYLTFAHIVTGVSWDFTFRVNCITIARSLYFKIFSASFFIIITIILIPFMQDIYNNMPATNHVSRVYSVEAVLYVQFELHVMLFHPWNMFCTFTSALPSVCLQCKIWLFLQFINFVLSLYVAQVVSEGFEMVPVAPVITSITFAFTSLVSWISVMRSL